MAGRRDEAFALRIAGAERQVVPGRIISDDEL
jgi:hypothetical protein